jgi:hypothetical protein
VSAIEAPPLAPAPPPAPPRPRPSPHTILGAISLEDPVARAQALERICERWARHAEPLYQEADKAYNFYIGNHYGYQSAALGTFVPIPTWSSDTVRRTINVIQPNTEQMVSILTAERPVFGAVAGTSETRDSAASEAADDLCEWIQREFDFVGMRRRMARGAGIAGSRYVLREWDPSAGAPVIEPGPVDPMTGQPGPPSMRPAGNFRFVEMSHRQVVQDPSAMRWGEGAALFCLFNTSKFALRNSFPQVDVESLVTTQGNEHMRRVWAIGQPAERGVSVTGDASERDDIVCTLAFIPRCAEFPQGLRVLTAGGIEFERTPNPVYPTPEEVAQGEGWPQIPWPVTQFVHLERESSPHGRGVVTAAISPQQQLNGIASKFELHISKASGVKLFVPAALTAEITDETAQVVPYPKSVDMSGAGYKNAPAVTNEYITAANWCLDRLNEIFGINASTKGISESEDSGRKTMSLQKRDIGRLQPTKDLQDMAELDLLRGSLFLFRRHADVKRKIDVVGENRRQAVRELDRTAILPNTNIVLYNDKSIPRDPSDRMLWLQSFLQTGVLQLPPEQREAIIQLMRLRDFKGFMEHQAPHRDRARRENLKLLNGEQIGILELDDHLIHLKVLAELVLSEEFENRCAAELQDPTSGGQSPTWVAALRHYGEHKQALLAMQMEQARAMAPPPAEPGAGGELKAMPRQEAPAEAA